MTNRTRTTTGILIAVLTLMTASALAQTDAQKAFTTIKTLPGTWEGDTHMGPVQVLSLIHI